MGNLTHRSAESKFRVEYKKYLRDRREICTHVHAAYNSAIIQLRKTKLSDYDVETRAREYAVEIYNSEIVPLWEKYPIIAPFITPLDEVNEILHDLAKK